MISPSTPASSPLSPTTPSTLPTPLRFLKSDCQTSSLQQPNVCWVPSPEALTQPPPLAQSLKQFRIRKALLNNKAQRFSQSTTLTSLKKRKQLKSNNLRFFAKKQNKMLIALYRLKSSWKHSKKAKKHYSKENNSWQQETLQPNSVNRRRIMLKWNVFSLQSKCREIRSLNQTHLFRLKTK